MKIIATSDLHGDLPKPSELPEGDVLVIAGDVMPDGGAVKNQIPWFDEVFVEWLTEVKKQFSHIIWIGGNHDFALQLIGGRINKSMPEGVHYLNESVVEIDGIKFYGAPWNMTQGWAFCLGEDGFEEKLPAVPDDTDVMIVHGPPWHDKMPGFHYCSTTLARWIAASKLKALICGHIHEAYGSYEIGTTPIHVVSRKDRDYVDINPFVEITI